MIRPAVFLAPRLARVLALACALALLAGAPPESSRAQAASLPQAVIAVIDYQRILRDAAAARGIRDQVETRRRTVQDEIAREEQRLHEADRELARQRTLLAAEAFAERRRAFEQDVIEVQRMVQERRRTLEETSAVALEQVREALIEVLADLAQEFEFNVVLPSATLLVYSPGLDLTDQALARLDQRLPRVQVPERVD